MHYLRQAIKQYHLKQINMYSNEVQQQETKEFNEEDFVNTVVSPDVVQMITKKLLKLTTPTPWRFYTNKLR